MNDENNIHIPSLGSQVKSPLFMYRFLQYIIVSNQLYSDKQDK